MSQLTDQMAADASGRLSLWIARSAGQRKRALHHEPDPVAPVSRFYEAGNIEFAGPEPDDDCEPLTLWESIIFAVELFAAILGTVTLIGVGGGYVARHYFGG